MKALILFLVSTTLSVAVAQTQPSAPTAPGQVVVAAPDPTAQDRYTRSKCTEPYEEYKTAFREAKKTNDEESKERREKILELKKEQVKDDAEIQEKIQEAKKRATDAEVAYQEAHQQITEELNELEKETNERATEMVREVQENINKLEENLTTERDVINNAIQEAKAEGYEGCKAQAEEMYRTLMGYDQNLNAAKNRGIKPTSGANLRSESAAKKIKARAIKHHSTCVAEVTRRLSASRDTQIKRLDTAKKRIEQELHIKSVEINRLTNTEYEKKVSSLHEKLRVAGLELQSAQTNAQQEVDRLQQQAAQQGEIMRLELMDLEQKSQAAKVFNPQNSEEVSEARSTAFSACCEKVERSGREVMAVATPGTVPSSFCKTAPSSRKNRNNRGSR